MSPGNRIVAGLLLFGVAEAVLAQAAPVCTTQTIDSDDINGISGSSDANVIAVGEDGTIERWDGSGWSGMWSGTGEDLFDVHVVDDNSAFAVGADGEVREYTGGFFWFDRGGFTGDDLLGVWAASANEAWVGGEDGGIWRWDGSGWSDASSAAGTGNRDIVDVHGDANFVYAMSDRGELYVYDRNAGSWASRIDDCRQGNNFGDVWSDGGGNVYLTRRDDIYRYDGSSCQVVHSDNEWMNGIYGGGGLVWAGGQTGDTAVFDGSSWSTDDVTDENINDVWVSSSGSAWFGEDDGQVTRCDIVQPNVIADWPLDDCTLGFDGSAVIDQGPNGQDGTATGGLAVENNGQLCSAGAFNGSSSYVRVPDSGALDTQDGLSIAVWIRHNGSPTNWESIVAKGDNSYRLHLNGGCQISDSLPGNTQFGITFGLNGGCAGADLNSNVVPAPGAWYHVAASYDRSEMRIYINGTLVNTASYSAAITNSSYDLGIGENTQQRGRYWNGDIDELTLWDSAISAQAVGDHMNRTRPCNACAAVEFAINHDGNGIHCSDETITVNVVDSLSGTPRTDYSELVTLDTQTGNGTWTLVSGSGTFTDAAADDGVATYDWPLGEDTAQFALSYRQGSSPFDIDVYQANDTGIRDTDAEGMITFNPSGFTVTSAPLGNPPPGTIPPFVAPQTAGVPFAVYLTAFGQTAGDPICGVIESYAGDKDLQVWNDYVDPGSGAIAPTVDGAPVAASEAGAGTQTVAFASGQATVTARYDDVGRIRLNFNDDNVSDPDLPNGIRGATAGFVSRPFSFLLSNIETPGGAPNPAAADAAGPVFVAAGAPFAATVTAVDADGDPTPNYGREATPESVVLVPALVDPAGGNLPGLSAGTGFGAFAGGRATGTDFAWPEVGIITLTPAVGDGSYLGTGNVTGAASGNVGRFIPDHFTVAQNVPAFATACAAGGFTYLGEPFGYAVPPVATVTARAAGGTVTRNYENAFFRMQSSTILNRSYAAVTGALDLSGLPPAAGDPAVVDNGSGVGTLTFDSGSGLAFSKASPESPFAAEIALSFEIFDADGVAALTNPVTFGASGGILFDSGSELRYGRVRFVNAIGSELVSLNVPMRSEYFVDTATGFVANGEDSCTSGVALVLGGFTNNLAAGETCVVENGAPGASGAACAASGPAGQRYREPPLGGDFNLWLAAPGDGNDGSLTVTGSVPAWLQFDWDAALPGFENPAGIATFGVYRGEDRRIYTRELY